MANWYDAPEYAGNGGVSFVNAYKDRYGESYLKTISDQLKSGLTPEEFGVQTPRYMDIIGKTAASSSNAPDVDSAKGVLSRYQELLSPTYRSDTAYKGMSAEDQAVIDKQQFQQKYGGMGAASLGDFETLLGRLEGSKIRQQQAKDVSVRPSIYAQGLANMMNNF